MLKTNLNKGYSIFKNVLDNRSNARRNPDGRNTSGYLDANIKK